MSIDKIQSSLEIASCVYDAVKRDFCLGMTEQDIKDIITKNSRGADFGGDIVAGVRSSLIEGDATDYVLKKGDCLILDLQFNACGMWSDTTRTFFVGDVSKEACEAYRAVLNALRCGEEALAEGVAACHIHKAVSEGFGQYAGLFPHHAGHLFGSEVLLQPQFLPENVHALKLGDTVTLEPGLYFEGRFGIRLEDNYLITSSGCENIFGYTRDIDYFVI